MVYFAKLRKFSSTCHLITTMTVSTKTRVLSVLKMSIFIQLVIVTILFAMNALQECESCAVKMSVLFADMTCKRYRSFNHLSKPNFW